jgi:signal transduction histidine kinase/ActR/RegA family two-component response regulator
MTDEDLMQKFGSRGLYKSDLFPGAYESVGKIYLRGDERVMTIQAARIFNAKGEVIGAVQTAQDITERIRIQQEQEKLQRQLVQAQKIEAIGTLAGGIAHDFNNILSGIMGYSELCLNEVQDRPKVYNFMEQVLMAADRARDLVKQILTFSSKSEQEKMPVVLAPIVKEVVKFMRASLPTTIEIRSTIDKNLGVILADSTQMHQVLMNLCTNAGHAMKEKGGILEIGLKQVVVEEQNLVQFHSLASGRYLELSVRDTGHGIPQEHMGRIFDPYFTTKEKGEGTGLGLAVVHGIVKDHGGDIRVYSERGNGTIIRIYLPMIEKKAYEERGVRKTVPKGKGETILFIDDEKMLVDMNKKMLETLGYQVITETDPVQAMEVFKDRNNRIDIVITDKTMPRMTGFDAAREIRALRPDMPVLICSGSEEKGDMEKLSALGLRQFIFKPISISTLAKAIREEIDNK